MAWQKGQSGNPNGRGRGNRDRVTDAFFRDLANDWNIHGRKAVEDLREKDVAAYCRIVASVVPKDISVEVNKTARQMTDDELIEILTRGIPAGSTQPDSGTQEHIAVH